MVSLAETLRVFGNLRDALRLETGEINKLAAHMVADYNNHAPSMADKIEKMTGRPARFPRSV